MKVLSILFLATFTAALHAADAPRPNIIFLIADDLGHHDVGFTGGKEIKTPNLDKLAASGARLDAFYVQPVCSPTRASLLTGRYPSRLGLQTGVVRPWAQYGLPLEERTLAQALHEAGYATAITGKWHLGHFQPEYLPTRRGFDHQYGHYNGALDYFTHIRDGGFDWHRDDRENRDEGYSTHLIAREAVRLIKERDKTKPLFLYVPFNGVHAPLQVPESYQTPYTQLKGKRRVYAGMVAAVDEAVGQITSAIGAEGLNGNTLFFFSSDNGGPQPGTVTDNGPLRAGKATLYEGGVRVAALAAWEGHIKPGTVVTQPLHIVDWYPTLLKLAGAKTEQPLALDGRDAWATIAEGAPSPHDDILINTTPTGGAIRAGDWKLVLNGVETGNENAEPDEATPDSPRSVGKVELFDLSKDLSEKQNLAVEHPEKVQELRERYEVYARQAVPPKARPKSPGFQTPKVWGQPD
ncbi:MAG: arylsulfatase family protein [Chthoniobacteraceae bacterium]|nr:arylsulfatase family protein [Chthoniobacteraceae bacterium]